MSSAEAFFDDAETLAMRGDSLRGIGRRISYEPASCNGRLPEAVTALAESNARVRRVVYTAAADLEEYPSPSEADMAVASLLALHRIGGGEIEATLRWRRANVDVKPKHAHYFTGTVERALGWAAERAQGSHAGRGGVDDSLEPPPPTDADRPEFLQTDGGAAAEPDQPHELTDMGNADRFVAQHGDDLRWVPQWDRWLRWNGHTWTLDDSKQMERMAKVTARSIYAEAASYEKPDEQDAAAKWARRSQERARIDNMIALSRCELPQEAETLDADPLLLGCPGGVLDLRSGKYRPGRPTDLITKNLGTDFDPEATAPTWERFLARVLPDPEVRAFVQRAVGYSLTGLIREHVFFVLYGTGRNGKSTFIETGLALLGEYARKSHPDFLLARRYSGIPNDVARLQGARFVAAVETGEGRRLDETRVKELTGGDTVSARFMRAEFFEFKPVMKLWLGTNHRPRVRGTDAGIWRRINLIPFTVAIPAEEVDEALSEKLLAELPGILNWALRGYREWDAKGLAPPPAVMEATQAYREGEDLIGRFLAQEVDFGPEAWVSSAELLEAFGSWWDDYGTGRRPEPAELTSALEARGCESARRYQPGPDGRKRQVRGWRGVACKGSGA